MDFSIETKNLNLCRLKLYPFPDLKEEAIFF